MNIRILCNLLFLLMLPIIMVGQKKSKFGSIEKKQSPLESLERAEGIKEKDPLDAIAIIENVISSERGKKTGTNILGQAYFLLGNIYEQIDQDDLAEQRYLAALKFKSKKEDDLGALIYYRLGVIDLQRRNEKGALINFNNCIQISLTDDIKLKCEEGIADIKIMINDNNAAIADLDSLKERYDLDSISLARIEARKSQAYTNLKDFKNASTSLQNSYNTIPRNNRVKKEDIFQIQKANEDFFSDSEVSNIDKIQIQNTIDYSNVNDDNVIRENLRKSILYEEDNKWDKAEEFLTASKNSITLNTTADLAAEVYKKSYETNLTKGKISIAFEDLQKYIDSKEKEISELENNLKEEIEIVKSQKKIDIAEKNYDLKQKDEILLKNQISTQRIIIGLLSLILFASIIFFYFLYKNIGAKKKANQMLYLKSLRTQMNPHFIFNALNSVNNFISQNDEKAANKFLADFSHLMRRVLEYSQQDFIDIQDEIELNELYLKLEHFRFRDKFEYTFDDKIEGLKKLEIPPMLIQPFIENAVWHGLRYKEGVGELKISFEETKKHLIVLIKDNGIGRTKSKALKTNNQKKYNSTGLNNVAKRIQLINEIYGKSYEINVRDLHPEKEDTGTLVKVMIPLD